MNDDQIIAFLCPNGHKLSGPASLQGKPGQCPHCSSKFVIPDYSEFAPDPDPADAEDVSGVISSGEVDLEPLEELVSPGDLESLSAEDTAIASVPPASLLPDSATAFAGAATVAGRPVSLQHAFELLWARRAAGIYMELHLKSGDILRPEFYAASSSGPSQGLFATRDDDGSYTLAAIAWDAAVAADWPSTMNTGSIRIDP